MPQQRMHVFSEAHISTAIWLTQLRWIAVAGQLLVIGYVWFALLVPLPIIELLLLVTGTAISNTILWLWAKSWKFDRPAPWPKALRGLVQQRLALMLRPPCPLRSMLALEVRHRFTQQSIRL